MREIWDMIRDPRLSAILAFIGVGVVGAVLILLSFQGMSGLDLVPYQVPYLVSGGLVGIALLGVAASLTSVHLDRVEAAAHREELQALRRETMALIGLVSERRAARSARTR